MQIVTPTREARFSPSVGQTTERTVLAWTRELRELRGRGSISLEKVDALTIVTEVLAQDATVYRAS